MEGSTEEESAWARCSSTSGSRRVSGAAGDEDDLFSRRVSGEVSLREWLDRVDRAVELVECLHIFRQVVEAVNLAHAHGVVVNNVRPSCFVLSSLNRVAFIESASCSITGSDSYDDEESKLPHGGGAASDASCPRRSSVEEVEDHQRGENNSKEDEKRSFFPLKQLLQTEFNWYTSPEEAAGEPSTFASDIYRLGVLLFELLCTFDSLDEKLRMMSNLRHRVLPPQLLLRWPKQASFFLWLLHPQPNTRPKMSEVLQSEFLNEPRDNLNEREAAIKLKEEIEDQELLLEFIIQLRQRKEEMAEQLRDDICFLSSDIEDIIQKQPTLHKKRERYLKLENDELEGETLGPSLLHRSAVQEETTCSASRKRSRPGFQSQNGEQHTKTLRQPPMTDLDPKVKDNVMSKSSRMMKDLKKLEAAYFATKYRMLKPSGRLPGKIFSVSNSSKDSIIRTEGSSMDDLPAKEGNTGGSRSDWTGSFLEGLCRYMSSSKLTVRADLKQGDLLNASSLVCALDFDSDKEFFATAGVNRKIKVFECDMILNEERGIHYPVVEMASKSKLSSICWNGYIKNQIASSDFEGVVQTWDVMRNQVLMEMREHERRVWSVDFSLADPTKLASGSDDRSVKLWNINQAGSICTIKTKANVCSVQFPPDLAHSLAIGSADHNVYIYDLRNSKAPLCTLVGHTKTVSYVKFVESSTLVSASTDNSLKLWDVSTSTSMVLDNPVQTFTGHTNVKNFVGLSVSNGYIATGSETNEVFVYHRAFPMPVLSHKFNTADPVRGCEADDAMQFISSVCWRGQTHTLLAANSTGNIKLLEMV